MHQGRKEFDGQEWILAYAVLNLVCAWILQKGVGLQRQAGISGEWFEKVIVNTTTVVLLESLLYVALWWWSGYKPFRAMICVVTIFWIDLGWSLYMCGMNIGILLLGLLFGLKFLYALNVASTH